MANLQISKLDNYIHILDMDKNQLYQEHSFRVLVRKLTPTGSTYDISFLRPDSTPAAFYSATIGQIFNAAGTPFSQVDWEVWYQNNTGDINVNGDVNGNVIITEPLGQQKCGDSVSTTLCDTQANVEVIPGINNVVGVQDMGVFIPTGILLSLSIYNQDTTSEILVSTDNGVTFAVVNSGVILNFDAGGLLNYMDPQNIIIDQYLATARPLIIYTYMP
jgi:hypothetical protein